MIADSSVLILFARINRLELLQQLYGIVKVPKPVYDECTASKHGDAALIRDAFSRNMLNIAVLSSDAKGLSEGLKRAHPQLGDAEAAVIALAIVTKSGALIDEHPARMAAKLQGVKCTGSLGVLIAAYSKGILSENQVKILFQALVRENIRVGGAVVAEFLDTLHGIRKDKTF
ncbi:DUF3368 domain-containing protein [Candidatus Woesearchaeota archaeon]|nr:DUF3368 domain-containing protein [Candidatus Woesearchaeota archaeon]